LTTPASGQTPSPLSPISMRCTNF